MFSRKIEDRIASAFELNKVVILLGARRVGKTTLIKSMIDKLPESRYINCELLQNRDLLQTTNSEKIFSFIGSYKYVVFDEAQSIPNIGNVLKIIHDTFPEIKIVATGSSALSLQQESGEPLTGRSRFFTMTAFSFSELVKNEDIVTASAKLENILRFGTYPDVYNKPEDFAIEELDNIASNYLYKDVLQFERLKKPEILYNLLKLLAFQVGNEVSLNELSNRLDVHVNTVKRYIELLENSFVIFSLSALSNNPRNEIGKNKKYYFYDCGIRNSIIRNFNPLDYRNDVGHLWENFIISEMHKNNFNSGKIVNSYFWRNYQKKEIDYIEEYGGKLKLYDCKYNPDRNVKIPTDFKNNYTSYDFNLVNTDNFWKFLE